MLLVCASDNDDYADHDDPDDDEDDGDDGEGLMVVWSADMIMPHCPTHLIVGLRKSQ